MDYEARRQAVEQVAGRPLIQHKKDLVLGEATFTLAGFLWVGDTDTSWPEVLTLFPNRERWAGEEELQQMLANANHIPEVLRGDITFVFLGCGDEGEYAAVAWRRDRWIRICGSTVEERQINYTGRIVLKQG